MAFVEHIPSRISTDYENKNFVIRLNKKRKSLLFYAAPHFFEKIGIYSGDRIKFYYDDEDLLKWKIHKVDNNEIGYKVMLVGKKLRLQIKLKIPGLQLDTIKSYQYELLSNGLQLIIN